MLSVNPVGEPPQEPADAEVDLLEVVATSIDDELYQEALSEGNDLAMQAAPFDQIMQWTVTIDLSNFDIQESVVVGKAGTDEQVSVHLLESSFEFVLSTDGAEENTNEPEFVALRPTSDQSQETPPEVDSEIEPTDPDQSDLEQTDPEQDTPEQDAAENVGNDPDATPADTEPGSEDTQVAEEETLPPEDEDMDAPSINAGHQAEASMSAETGETADEVTEPNDAAADTEPANPAGDQAEDESSQTSGDASSTPPADETRTDRDETDESETDESETDEDEDKSPVEDDWPVPPTRELAPASGSNRPPVGQEPEITWYEPYRPPVKKPEAEPQSSSKPAGETSTGRSGSSASSSTTEMFHESLSPVDFSSAATDQSEVVVTAEQDSNVTIHFADHAPGRAQTHIVTSGYEAENPKAHFTPQDFEVELEAAPTESSEQVVADLVIPSGESSTSISADEPRIGETAVVAPDESIAGRRPSNAPLDDHTVDTEPRTAEFTTQDDPLDSPRQDLFGELAGGNDLEDDRAEAAELPGESLEIKRFSGSSGEVIEPGEGGEIPIASVLENPPSGDQQAADPGLVGLEPGEQRPADLDQQDGNQLDGELARAIAFASVDADPGFLSPTELGSVRPTAGATGSPGTTASTTLVAQANEQYENTTSNSNLDGDAAKTGAGNKTSSDKVDAEVIEKSASVGGGEASPTRSTGDEDDDLSNSPYWEIAAADYRRGALGVAPFLTVLAVELFVVSKQPAHEPPLSRRLPPR